MNASKTLMAAITAATIVGTVGFVSAQTTGSSAPSTQGAESLPKATNGSQQRQQSAWVTAPADMSAPPYVAPDTGTPSVSGGSGASKVAPAGGVSSPSAAPAGETALSAEPAPKADRN